MRRTPTADGTPSHPRRRSMHLAATQTPPRTAVLMATLAATLAGCTLAANGTALEDELASGTSTGTAESSTSSPSSSSSSSSGVGDSDETGTDVSSSSSSSSTGSEAAEPARLAFRLDVPEVQFGEVEAGQSTTRVLLLDNLGGSAATSIVTAPIDGDFSIPGGFPGTSGDCDTTLEAGESCRVEVRFGPNRIGPAQAEFELEYYDGIDLSAPTQTDVLFLEGGGTGSSANLLINGDAESGNLDPWDSGLNGWSVSADASQGQFAFFSDGGGFTVTTLEQTVELNPAVMNTELPGLRFELRGLARSASTHPYSVNLRFDGAAELTAVTGAESEYTAFDSTGTVALGSSSMTVELRCTNGGSGDCPTYFDELELRVVYP